VLAGITEGLSIRSAAPLYDAHRDTISRELLGGGSQHLPGEAALMHADGKDDFAADHAIEDALRTFDQARHTAREIICPFERTGPDAPPLAWPAI